jgi:hypothetical protein
MANNNKKQTTPSSKNRKKKSTGNTSSLVEDVSRNIQHKTQLFLYVLAGGRCEFDGCNKYLLNHHLTRTLGNFAEMAHIVAFKPDGPRGQDGLRPEPEYINNIDNLMLLCSECHKLIDDHPENYKRETLEKYKLDHEQRIFRLTATKPDHKTTIVQLKSKIGGQAVAIPAPHVNDAVAPRYPEDPKGYIIDLTGFDQESDAFFEAAKQQIKREVEKLYAAGMEVEATRHISLFALAPIPLLIYLGSRLSNKVPVEPYQRHRDTEDWVWKTDGQSVGYDFRHLQVGTDKTHVALVLSLSGTIRRESLPAEIDDTFFIYEITLANKVVPSPAYLCLKQDLTAFKEVYLQVLRIIARDHGQLNEIHLFPAVPAPIAVLCGREILPKIEPALVVYDNDKNKRGFKLIFKVNEHEY